MVFTRKDVDFHGRTVSFRKGTSLRFSSLGSHAPIQHPLRVVTCFLNLNPNTAKTAQLRSSMSRKDLPSEQICQQNRKTTKQTNNKKACTYTFFSFYLKLTTIISLLPPYKLPKSQKLQKHRIKPTKLSESIEIMQSHRSRNLKSSSQ